MTSVINDLVASVRRQVQDDDVIGRLVDGLAQEDYRRVFLMLVELRECGQWILSKSDEEALEEFWWEYAN